LIFQPKRVKAQLELHLRAAKPEAVNYRWGNLVIYLCYYELFDVKTTIFKVHIGFNMPHDYIIKLMIFLIYTLWFFLPDIICQKNLFLFMFSNFNTILSIP
jgi:hypothetical protein